MYVFCPFNEIKLSNPYYPIAREINVNSLLKIDVSVIIFEKHFLSFFLLKFYHLCIPINYPFDLSSVRALVFHYLLVKRLKRVLLRVFKLSILVSRR